MKIILTFLLFIQFNSFAQLVTWDIEVKHEFFKCQYCESTCEEITPAKVFNVSDYAFTNEIIVSGATDLYPNQINKVNYINATCQSPQNPKNNHVYTSFKVYNTTATNQKCNVGDADLLMAEIDKTFNDITFAIYKDCLVRYTLAMALGKK